MVDRINHRSRSRNRNRDRIQIMGFQLTWRSNADSDGDPAPENPALLLPERRIINDPAFTESKSIPSRFYSPSFEPLRNRRHNPEMIVKISEAYYTHAHRNMVAGIS